MLLSHFCWYCEFTVFTQQKSAINNFLILFLKKCVMSGHAKIYRNHCCWAHITFSTYRSHQVFRDKGNTYCLFLMFSFAESEFSENFLDFFSSLLESRIVPIKQHKELIFLHKDNVSSILYNITTRVLPAQPYGSLGCIQGSHSGIHIQTYGIHPSII